MKVTVVTPVYNGMPWLPECVGSVAMQRGDADVEHLVYDGGSTDGSAEWLREHASIGYEAIFGPDGGQTDALAKGFDRIGRPGFRPSPVSIAGTVRAMILRSSQNDQRSMYSRSFSTQRSNSASLRAPICQSPVMPGFMESRRRCQTS